MKLMYNKRALRKAAKYLFKKNPLKYTNSEEIEVVILGDMRKTAQRNKGYVDFNLDNWIRMTGTMGYYLNFSLEDGYIECNILVQPSFGECAFVEEEL